MSLADYYQKHPELLEKKPPRTEPPAPQPEPQPEPQPVVRPAPRPEPKKDSRKGLWTCVVVLLVLILMGATCPSTADHKEAVVGVVRDYMDHQSDSNDGWEALGTALMMGAVNVGLNQYLHVDKYLVVSVGRLEVPGQDAQLLSVGVLGHVFTLSEEQVDELVQQNMR